MSTLSLTVPVMVWRKCTICKKWHMHVAQVKPGTVQEIALRVKQSEGGVSSQCIPRGRKGTKS